MPSLISGSRYKSCCGKVICSGCICAPVYDDQGNEVDNEKCPFCRAPTPETYEEVIERLNKRVEAGEAEAIYLLGGYYCRGRYDYGVSQDRTKAFELWHRAAEFGHAKACSNIGSAYNFGKGVETDKKKAKHYFELSAMRGEPQARCNLGNTEHDAGNIERALKHYMIAVRNGHNDSLKNIKKYYSDGYATKKDYAEALRSFQEYLGEIKSRQRDAAAAAHEKYRYY